MKAGHYEEITALRAEVNSFRRMQNDDLIEELHKAKDVGRVSKELELHRMDTKATINKLESKLSTQQLNNSRKPVGFKD